MTDVGKYVQAEDRKKLWCRQHLVFGTPFSLPKHQARLYSQHPMWFSWTVELNSRQWDVDRYDMRHLLALKLHCSIFVLVVCCCTTNYPKTTDVYYLTGFESWESG